MKLLMEGWKDWLNRDKDVEEIPREKVSSISDIATSAEIGEDVTVVLSQLKDILKVWEEAEYESDEERWKSYAEDIQSLIDKYEEEPSAPTATKWSKAAPTTGDDPDAPFEE